MGNTTVEKVMKLLTPLSCDEVRERFDLLAQTEGELSEEGEWVQEHLLVCDDCLAAFTNTMKAQVEQGNLREAWVEKVPMPLSPLAGKTLGVLWDQVKHFAAQGVEWAMEQLDETQRCIQGAMQVWQMASIMAGGGLGQKAALPVFAPMMGAKGITAEADVVDVNWQVQKEKVRFDITEGPVITQDGDFLLTLQTQESQWHGAQVICTVTIVEGQRVSVVGNVEADPSGAGGRVRFEAAGFSSPPTQQVEIPVEFIHLSVIASR